jgi:2-furoyl-CoA dehydrogenase FAD binding subunit
VKPAPFDYHRPGSLPEALAALAGEPNAKVLAGGQSLVPLLSMRLAAPAALVDINAVPGLAAITVEESGGRSGVRVGALARHADVLASTVVRRVQPLVTEALAHVAHATIRNRGTTVGSIVHADAAAEMPAVLLLLGGSVEAASVRGTRTIGAGELFLGPLESALAADEIATSAFFPGLPAGAGVAFDEIARRHGDYALCGVAAIVDGASVRAAYVSVADVPTVVDLSGVPLAETGEAALAELEPAADIHASAAYRAQLVRVLTERVVRAATARAATTPTTASTTASTTARTTGGDA